ncbi:MAG: hypothetical protein M4579_007234 [Chaenotheca gracillima]|nr:MAG: hypothetical protein M4579_007234 [Chaenotheca gracillima]
MKGFQQAGLSVALAAAAAQAFKVDFYNSDNCAGEFVGEFIGGTGQGCRTDYVGVSEGALVQSTGPVDDGFSVAFYSSNDCNPGNAVAEADNNCVEIDSEVGAYMSFNVIGGQTGGGFKKRAEVINENRKKIKRDVAEKREAAAAEKQLRSVVKRAASPGTIQHGDFGDVDGKTYRYHQVANGVWRGVDPNDWDDKVHVKNDAALNVSPKSKTRDLILDELDERDFTGTCKAALSCAIGLASNAKWGCVQVVDQLVSLATAANNNSPQIWEFLNQPFIVAVTVGSPAVAGVVSAFTSKKISSQPVASCSTVSTEADVIASAVKAALSLANDTAIQLNFTLPDGSIIQMSMQTTQYGTQGQCSAPSTDPSTGP